MIDPISVIPLCVAQEEHNCILNFRCFHVPKIQLKRYISRTIKMLYFTILVTYFTFSPHAISHCIRLYKCRYNTRHLCFGFHFHASCN